MRRIVHRLVGMGGAIAALAAVTTIGVSASPLATAGTGMADGSVNFATPFPAGCCAFGTDSYSIAGSGYGVVGNTAVTVYPGPFNIGGSGGSGSASLAGESGNITVNVNGTNGLGGFIYCNGSNSSTSLTGGYVRFFSAVVVDISGTCNVNFWTAPIQFTAAGQFMPDPTQPGNGNGITGPVKYAIFAVAWTVTPAVP